MFLVICWNSWYSFFLRGGRSHFERMQKQTEIIFFFFYLSHLYLSAGHDYHLKHTNTVSDIRQNLLRKNYLFQLILTTLLCWFTFHLTFLIREILQKQKKNGEIVIHNHPTNIHKMCLQIDIFLCISMTQTNSWILTVWPWRHAARSSSRSLSAWSSEDPERRCICSLLSPPAGKTATLQPEHKHQLKQ